MSKLCSNKTSNYPSELGCEIENLFSSKSIIKSHIKYLSDYIYMKIKIRNNRKVPTPDLESLGINLSTDDKISSCLDGNKINTFTLIYDL